MTANLRPKLLLLIPHLGSGGAERVTELLARGLSANKYEVHLGLITQAKASEKLPSSVQIHALGAPRVRAGAFRLFWLVRRLKPDLIVSGIFHLNFLVLLLRPFFPKGTRVLVRQNGTVSTSLKYDGLPWYTLRLYKWLYRRADRVICQTRAMAEDLSGELGLAASQLAVLPNPVDLEEIRRSMSQGPAPQTENGPFLLAVGRLSPEKGFDLLLQALVLVRREYPETSLLIAGAGPEEQALKTLCHTLSLDTAVRFAGYLDSPWSYFPAATLFVLPSRHEGLPNALLEAAVAGLPIVATPASGGVVDLLRDQPGVWLASEISAKALAASLVAALLIVPPGKRFAHPFANIFRIDSAIQAYEDLIDRSLAVRR